MLTLVCVLYSFFAMWFEVVNDQVMNLKEEFKEAQGWVKESLIFDINKVIKIIFSNKTCIVLYSQDDSPGRQLV